MCHPRCKNTTADFAQTTTGTIIKLLPVLKTRVILVGKLFSQIFDIFLAQFFNLPYFPVFFSKYWNVNELDIFVSGEFHE